MSDFKRDRMTKVPFVVFGPVKIEPLKPSVGKIYSINFRYKRDKKG